MVGKGDILALGPLTAMAQPERCYFSKVLCFILIFPNTLCSFIKLFSPQRQKIGSSIPFYTIKAQFIMRVPR